MTIGELGVIGATFPDRIALAASGIHRATQAGITGEAKQGAESIVLSGGYIDDEDNGSEIVYTGHGGRDVKTGRQVADQSFTRQNQALVTSCLNGLPVRVIRGANHSSANAPATGYRYDGLYFVESYWSERGKDGFLICRFKLVQNAYPPAAEANTNDLSISQRPSRVSVLVSRVVRDSILGRRLKEMYGYRCQVCGEVLNCVGGSYAEAAHIRPVGKPHHGPDDLDNLLCLCPNHHVLFDRGGFTVGSDLRLIGIDGTLHVHRDHKIHAIHLEYHQTLWKGR